MQSLYLYPVVTISQHCPLNIFTHSAIESSGKIDRIDIVITQNIPKVVEGNLKVTTKPLLERN